jgi:hypothetical protein
LQQVAQRINTLKNLGRLRKGEILILEEAGANFGNLDFQNKVNKMFSYILQSFRSMNLILLLTVPVLTMINKTARQLVHGHFVTCGIDYQKKTAKVKPYMHQLNQSSGKSYWKYPRVKVNNKIITLERLSFNLPSDKLLELYEKRKEQFVFNLTDDFLKESAKNEKKEIMDNVKRPLTDKESSVYNRLMQGLTKEEIALSRECTVRNIEYYIENMYRKGWDVYRLLEISKKSKIRTCENDQPLI